MQPRDRKFVVICLANSHLYWSNDLGWTAIEESTLFDECELPFASLPMGGAWREVNRLEQKQYWSKTG